MNYWTLRFTGEGFAPVSEGSAQRLRDDFGAGEIVRFQRYEERSSKSHAHFFASVHEAWSSLPESLADEFPSADSLRKYALIKRGYCTERKIVCASAQEAIRTAALLQEMDAFSIVRVDEKTVTLYRAESQSLRSMGKQKFQESKDAVLSVLSELIGTDVAALSSARAA